jgi:hypothetical protein
MNVKRILLAMLSVVTFAIVAIAQPTTNPTTPPARTAAQVISIYSAAYTNVASVNLNPNWNQDGFGTATEITVSGNQIRQYLNMNYQGVDFGSNQNVSSLDSVHFDIWSSNCTSIGIFLVANNGGGEREITRSLNLNAWNSIDIKLSDFVAVPPAGFSLNEIFQFKFVAKTPASGANVWIDNMYFYTNSNLPTLSNFSIPATPLGSAPFTITAPTSNSSGAFTYTSSNTSVATISGNQITAVGGGTSTITATQAAAGSFSAGSITTSFVVTLPPLSTNAPNPTKPAANVISLFSNTYPNVPVDTWKTSWSAAVTTLLDTAISGNNIKKYGNLDFVGIEFNSGAAPNIDATLADTFHVSIWTPDATKFRVKLVNFGTTTTEGEVWYTSDANDAGLPNKVGEKPVQGQWNVYSIPLSRFTSAGLAARNKLAQLLFVGAPVGTGTFYVDNIYFSSSTNILPVDFTSVVSSKNGNAVQVNWSVANEINVKEYVVEKSTDGVRFNSIGSVVAKNANAYSFTDNSLANGTTYYRIKAVDNDGKTKYSSIVSVSSNAITNSLSVYPNPANSLVNIAVAENNSSISIINSLGKTVKQINVVNAGNNVVDVASFAKGTYIVLVASNKATYTTKLVVE